MENQKVDFDLATTRGVQKEVLAFVRKKLRDPKISPITYSKALLHAKADIPFGSPKQRNIFEAVQAYFSQKEKQTAAA